MFNNTSSPFAGLPPVVKNLLIINIICFIGTSLIFTQGNYLFGVYYPDSPGFHYWQLITYMFMHAGIGHIFFNMFALFMFGPILEQILGSKRFINFYLIAGLGALALQFGVQALEIYSVTGSVSGIHHFKTLDIATRSGIPAVPISEADFQTLLSVYVIPMVGASGAIYGLLIAFGYLFPNTSLYLMFIPVPVKAKYFIPALIVIELFLGVSQVAGTSVAHFAHLGGALFGFLLIKLWGIKRPNNMW